MDEDRGHPIRPDFAEFEAVLDRVAQLEEALTLLHETCVEHIDDPSLRTLQHLIRQTVFCGQVLRGNLATHFTVS